MKSHVLVAVLVAVTSGAIAITIGVTSGSTPLASLIVAYLANVSTGSAVAALILWARDTALAEIRASAAVRRAVLGDDDSTPRIRGIRT